MGTRPYFQAIFAVTSALLASAALPVFNASAAEAAYVKVEAAGERAHFAQAFCRTAPERVDAYKARLRTRLSDAEDFDQHWQVGWTRANRVVNDMNSLCANHPEVFASRIKVNGERLKWMAENSLRGGPHK